MKLRFVSKIEQLPDAIVIPFGKTNDFEDLKNRMGKRYGVPASFFELDWQPDEKEILTVFAGDKTLYLVGTGTPKNKGCLARSLRTVIHKNKKKLPVQVGVDLSFAERQHLIANEDLLFATVNGCRLGQYNNHLYKTTSAPKKGFLRSNATLVIHTGIAPRKAKNIGTEALQLSESQIKIFDLVNKPANKKYPDTLVAFAKKNAKAGYRVQVTRGKDLIKKGFHAIYAVGQASPHPSALIVMEYKPKKAKRKIALIGKGVTFDTGGISLKPAAKMHLMKSDMGGAAAVLGAMEAIANANLPVHVIGLVASAENAIGANAIKPGDIIDSYSGKTIEVLNTDAEGRLVLADALAYAKKKFNPDIMIDLATLTGSIMRALGKHAAGLFTKNDQLAQRLTDTGEYTGERLWRMPLWDEYQDEMKSDIADIKNLASSPNAGAITAAKFLEFFTGSHPEWAHLDIAGQALNENEFSKQANATAFGVSLLYHFAKNLS